MMVFELTLAFRRALFDQHMWNGHQDALEALHQILLPKFFPDLEQAIFKFDVRVTTTCSACGMVWPIDACLSGICFGYYIFLTFRAV
jgi:hypothetical protein